MINIDGQHDSAIKNQGNIGGVIFKKVRGALNTRARF